MNLDAATHGDALAIAVNEPRIDAAIAIKFKDKVRELAASGPARVVLDMSRVDFLDSSGLGALVASMKQLGATTTLELACLTPPVAKVFHLTRMDSVFTVHDNMEDAVTKQANNA